MGFKYQNMAISRDVQEYFGMGINLLISRDILVYPLCLDSCSGMDVPIDLYAQTLYHGLTCFHPGTHVEPKYNFVILLHRVQKGRRAKENLYFHDFRCICSIYLNLPYGSMSTEKVLNPKITAEALRRYGWIHRDFPKFQTWIQSPLWRCPDLALRWVECVDPRIFPTKKDLSSRAFSSCSTYTNYLRIMDI